MAFRGDETCSVICEKVLAQRDTSGIKVVAPSECS